LDTASPAASEIVGHKEQVARIVETMSFFTNDIPPCCIFNLFLYYNSEFWRIFQCE
jgi:hypothetical protein